MKLHALILFILSYLGPTKDVYQQKTGVLKANNSSV